MTAECPIKAYIEGDRVNLDVETDEGTKGISIRLDGPLNAKAAAAALRVLANNLEPVHFCQWADEMKAGGV